MASLTLEPIGVYESSHKHKYDTGRQPRPDDPREGVVRLHAGHNFEQALTGLEGFERIWLIFQFHENTEWSPMVRPPRGLGKQGVFATRAPYRPNALGLSCVKLLGIEGRVLKIQGADLLDGTPVLDVKPYVPEHDAFPHAKAGWLEGLAAESFHLHWSALALEKCKFLKTHGVDQLEHFARQQLEFAPFDGDRKRVEPDGERWVLAYRTWRLAFREREGKNLEIEDVFSGYSAADLAEPADKWADKDLHRRFGRLFQK